MEISKYLRQHSRTIAGKSQLFINSYAKALEVHLLLGLDVLRLCFLISGKLRIVQIDLWLGFEICLFAFEKKNWINTGFGGITGYSTSIM